MLLGDASGRVPPPYDGKFFKSNRDASGRERTSTPLRQVTRAQLFHFRCRWMLRSSCGFDGPGEPSLPSAALCAGRSRHFLRIPLWVSTRAMASPLR